MKAGAKTGIASVLALAATVVAYHEGYVPYTYSDPVGIPTACYGHTGPDVTPGRRYTEGECRALLEGDIATANVAVWRCISRPLPPHVEAAFTSLAYNIGGKALCGSTLARKANAGDIAGACAELDRWVYAKGIKLRGLVRRRAAERALCEGKAG